MSPRFWASGWMILLATMQKAIPAPNTSAILLPSPSHTRGPHAGPGGEAGKRGRLFTGVEARQPDLQDFAVDPALAGQISPVERFETRRPRKLCLSGGSRLNPDPWKIRVSVTNGQWLSHLNVRFIGPLAVRYRATASRKAGRLRAVPDGQNLPGEVASAKKAMRAALEVGQIHSNRLGLVRRRIEQRAEELNAGLGHAPNRRSASSQKARMISSCLAAKAGSATAAISGLEILKSISNRTRVPCPSGSKLQTESR